MIKVLVFDFDGVIADSNRPKYEAFFRLFPDDGRYGPAVREVLALYREKTRGFIIEKVLSRCNEAFLGSDELKRQVDLYSRKYNDMVEDAAATCPEIPGARASLEVLSERYPLYINSTTPLEPLRRIVKRRSLDGLFKGIYGSPGSKAENLSAIIEKEKVEGKEAVVIGDGGVDLESAERFGCTFIGVRNAFNGFDGTDFRVLDDLRGLPSLIKEMAEEG